MLKAFKIFKASLFVLSVVFIVDVSAFLVFNKYVQHEIPFLINPPVSDGIIVFHGDRRADGIGNESITRSQWAAHLLQDQRGKGIFCTCEARPESGYYGCVLIREHLIKQGLNPEEIIADSRSNDTLSNIYEALAAAQTHTWRSLTFVSDQIHLMRIRVLLREFTSLPHIVFSPRPPQMIDGMGRFVHTWLRTHYEWTAWIAWKVIPSSVYRSLLNIIRGHYNSAA